MAIGWLLPAITIASIDDCSQHSHVLPRRQPSEKALKYAVTRQHGAVDHMHLPPVKASRRPKRWVYMEVLRLWHRVTNARSLFPSHDGNG